MVPLLLNLAETGIFKTGSIIWTTQDVWSEGHWRPRSHSGTSGRRQRSLCPKQPTPSHTEKGYFFDDITDVVMAFAYYLFVLFRSRSGTLWKSMTQAAQQVAGGTAWMSSMTPACCLSPTWFLGQTTEKVKPWLSTSVGHHGSIYTALRVFRFPSVPPYFIFYNQ